MNVKKAILVAISSLCVFFMLVVSTPSIHTMGSNVDYTADLTLSYVIDAPIQHLLNSSDLSDRQISAIYNTLLPYFYNQLNAYTTSGGYIRLRIPFSYDINNVEFFPNAYTDYRNYNLVGDFISPRQTFTLTLDITDLPSSFYDTSSLRDYPLFFDIWLDNIVKSIDNVSLSSDINFSVSGSRRSSGGHRFYDLTFTLPSFSAHCYTRSAYFDNPMPHLNYYSTNPEGSDIVWTSYNPADPTYNHPNVSIEGLGSEDVIPQPSFDDVDTLTPIFHNGELWDFYQFAPVVRLNGQVIKAGVVDGNTFGKTCDFNLYGLCNYINQFTYTKYFDSRLPYVDGSFTISYDSITEGLLLSYNGYDFSVTSWHFDYGWWYQALGYGTGSDHYVSPSLTPSQHFSGGFTQVSGPRALVLDISATPYSNTTPVTFDIVGSSSSHGDYDNWEFISSPKLFLKRNYSPVTILLENIQQTYVLDTDGNKVSGDEFERVIDGNGNEYLKQTHYGFLFDLVSYWSIDSFSYVLNGVSVTENPYFYITSIGSNSNIDFSYTVHLVENPFEYTTENVLPDTPNNPSDFSDYFDFQIPVSILHSSTIFMFIFGLVTTIPEIAILCVVLAILGILRTMRDK